jgi:pimeloyl-ACP methyl ester carboxylesterase
MARGISDVRAQIARLGGAVEAFVLARRPPPVLIDEERRRGISRVELDVASIRIRDTGPSTARRTFVIVPDPPNTIEHYDDLIDRLRPHGRVVCFEVPGFGLSLPRSMAFGFGASDYVTVIGELLDRLDLRDVTLVMSCIGGYVALIVARERPDRIGDLVLSQTPAHRDMLRWARLFDPVGVLGLPVLGQAIIWALQERATRFWYPKALPIGADANPFIAHALAAQARGGPYALASGIQAMRRLDPSLLFGVRQPVTIAWGHADRTHARSDPRSLIEVVPHARFVSFERCGHFPDLEDPARFAELVVGPAA